MIKLTLDTNCIINLLDYKSESAISVDELIEIIRYGLDGDVNIAITTRVESDINKDKDQERKNEIVKRILMFPVIGTVARWDTSKWNSGDVWGGQEHQALENEIKIIIFPGLKEDDPHYTNKINDIDHLLGHKINKRDIFVTDDRQILKKAETLKLSLDIEVMDPKQVLEYLNSQANKIVLAQEFYDKFLEYKDIVVSSIHNNKIDKQALSRYEELRKWLMRKYSAIQDGLLNFKFKMISVPSGSQRVFGRDDLMSLQMFNDRLNGILKERDPLHIPKIASTHRHDYASYRSKSQEVEITISFLNSIEDSLLAYIGKLESM